MLPVFWDFIILRFLQHFFPQKWILQRKNPRFDLYKTFNDTRQSNEDWWWCKNPIPGIDPLKLFSFRSAAEHINGLAKRVYCDRFFNPHFAIFLVQLIPTHTWNTTHYYQWYKWRHMDIYKNCLNHEGGGNVMIKLSNARQKEEKINNPRLGMNNAN